MGIADGTCQICNAACDIKPREGVGGADVDCKRCGKYHTVLGSYWEPNSMAATVRLAGWVREQNNSNVIPAITKEIAGRVMAMPLPRYKERAQTILRWLNDKGCIPGSLYPTFTYCGDKELFGRSYSEDFGDVGVLLQVLESEGYIVQERGHKKFRLTIPGLLAAEELDGAGGAFAQGFVAMDFNTSMDEAWSNGFFEAIRATGFRPRRIDRKDYVGGITDEIMAEIRLSRFVVADYTGQKAGVYFEAGFALGLGLIVIPTCRADELDELHFDVRHLNTLPWEAPSDLADKLAKRIRAVIGVGPDLADVA